MATQLYRDNIPKVGGSSPSPRTMRFLTWAENLGKEECPYLRRWVVNCGLFSIRLHHWLGSDDQRHLHDHPWAFITIVLRGGYIDRDDTRKDRLLPGSIRVRSATYKHSVRVRPSGCWSLVLTGPEVREWGFWVKGRFRKRNKYFRLFGHHPCS